MLHVRKRLFPPRLPLLVAALVILPGAAVTPAGAASTPNAVGRQVATLRAAQEAVTWSSHSAISSLQLLQSIGGSHNRGLSAHRSNATGYADPTGDVVGNLAPDITSVGIANDDSGNLAFVVNIPNRAGLIDGDFLSIFLDADQNPATGSQGSDYILSALGEAGQDFFSLCQWQGTWNCSVPQGSAVGAYPYGSYRLTWKLSRGDIGNSIGFNFDVGTSYKGIYDTYYDFAPDLGKGKWNYQILTAASQPPPPPPPPPPVAPPPAPTTTTTPAPPSPAPVVCVIPRVVGRTLASARILIFNANCAMGRVTKARSSRPKGLVIAQAPRAGTTRVEGGIVKLIVSRGRR